MAAQNPFDALPTGASFGTRPSDDSPPQPVYSPAQVTGATFFGGVMAGSILIGLNHRNHGHSERALWTVLGGLAASMVLIGIGVVLPDNVPGMGIPIASTFAMRGYAQSLLAVGYGRDVREAPSGPLGVVVGVVFVGLLVTLIVAVTEAFGAALVLD